MSKETFGDYIRKAREEKNLPLVDGHRSHFTKDVKAYVKSTKGKLKIYALPPYSPQINPDELVWNNAKQKVAKKKYTPNKKTFKEKVKEVQLQKGFIQYTGRCGIV
jgi:transposase